MSQLPRQEDINVYDSLDERSAVRSFLGKTREDILQRLPGEYESLQEDLAFMGPVAFAYYAPAWEEFCRTRPSDDPEGTEDIVRWTLCIISNRCNGLEDEIPGSIAAMRRMLSWCEGFYNSAEGRTYFTEEARFWGYSEPLLSTPPELQQALEECAALRRRLGETSIISAQAKDEAPSLPNFR